MKRLNSLISLTLIFTLLLSLPVFAKINEGTTDNSKDIQVSEQRLDVFNSIIAKHMANKSSGDVLQKELKQNGFTLINTEKENKSSIPEGLLGDMGIESLNTYVDCPCASIYYDDLDPSKFIASGFFFWDSGLWEYDLPSPCPQSGNMGGTDAFGISFDKPITIYAKDFLTWDRNGNLWEDTSIADTQNTYGVAFAENDQYFSYGDDYTWDSGFVSVKFLPQQSGVYSAWQTLGHTWSTTGISNISISSSGIGVSFTSSNYRWTHVAPESAHYTF